MLVARKLISGGFASVIWMEALSTGEDVGGLSDELVDKPPLELTDESADEVADEFMGRLN